MKVKKQRLELDMEQRTGSKLRRSMSRLYIVPCWFHLYAEYIMRNVALDEAQVGIKIVRRNINNLRYADDTTLLAKSKEELKGLLKKVKEDREKDDLKLNIQKIDCGSQSHHFMANRWGDNGNSDRLYFLGLQNHFDSDCSHEIKRCLILEGKLW